jgi:cytochrome c oxidase cbb3-type subunit 2
MNNGLALFLGLFASMAISWVTFVLGPQAQLGNLQPAATVAALPAVYPNAAPGLARQGAEVYRACGCVYCHTAQVRPTELGSDLAHGWGIRRSVAHDYIYDQTVMLGAQRVGPDLANAGLRMDATAVLARLWDARIVEPKSLMPPYKYLFEVRKIGRTPSPNALVVQPEFAAPQGYEIVPRPAARALAAYVAGLRQEPYLFEAPPPPGSVSTNAAAGGTNAPAGDTNAPAGGTNASAAGSGVPALPGGTNAANRQLAAPTRNQAGSAIANPQSNNAPAK